MKLIAALAVSLALFPACASRTATIAGVTCGVTGTLGAVSFASQASGSRSDGDDAALAVGVTLLGVAAIAGVTALVAEARHTEH